MPEAKSVVYGVWFEDSCLKQDKHFFFFFFVGLAQYMTLIKTLSYNQKLNKTGNDVPCIPIA